MKTPFLFLKDFIEKNGMIKLIVAFIIVALSVVAYSDTKWRIFVWTFWIPAVYIIVVFFSFCIAGIVNTIKDVRNKRKNT